MKNPRYRPPKILKQWVHDIPDGELYELMVFDNGSVCSACGRYAHSSGSTTCTWGEFVEGKMHDLVARTVGHQALNEAITFVSSQIKSGEKRWWQFWL